MKTPHIILKGVVISMIRKIPKRLYLEQTSKSEIMYYSTCGRFIDRTSMRKMVLFDKDSVLHHYTDNKPTK